MCISKLVRLVIGIEIIVTDRHLQRPSVADYTHRRLTIEESAGSAELIPVACFEGPEGISKRHETTSMRMFTST